MGKNGLALLKGGGGGGNGLAQSYIVAPTSPSVSGATIASAIESQLAQLTTTSQPAPSEDLVKRTAFNEFVAAMRNAGFPTSRTAGMYYYISRVDVLPISPAIQNTLNAVAAAGFDANAFANITGVPIISYISSFLEGIWLGWGYQVGSPPTVDSQTISQFAREAVIQALARANVSISSSGKAFVAASQITAIRDSAVSIMVQLLSQEGVQVV